MVLSVSEPAWALSSYQDQPVVVEQLELLENDVNLHLVVFPAPTSCFSFPRVYLLAKKVYIGWFR